MLEEFLEDNKGKVKMYYKPYPLLPMHAPLHAEEAAEAGEWARSKGLFWPMHDALFAHAKDLTVDDLVTYANQIGGDGEDLRKALETHKFKARVDASVAEGKAAGVNGTPTLFMNGRLVPAFDISEPMLDFTLSDELEWQKMNGWQKD